MLFSFSGYSRFLSAATLLAVSAFLFQPASVFAQAVSVAEVNGYVVDQTGAPVSGAQVKITETEKRQVHETITDAQGRYALPNLPVGAYQLEVTSKGFKDYVQSGITLQVANNVQLNVTMQLGSITEKVVVTANAEMVETKDNALSEVIDQKRVVDLPLNGRNPTQLILLTGAAVSVSSPPGGDLTGSKNIQGSNGSGTFSVAGSQANGLNYLLDGGDNNDAFSNVNLPVPFPDALQEFSVETNALPAQFGLHPGGVVNIVTKSGTNGFHGDLFEFLRNGDLNARQEGTNARDTLKRSQFGGVAGGRIIKDKLFFFGGYQGTRQRSNPPSTISYVPNATVLSGNFSTLDASHLSGGCLSSSTGIQLKNPNGGTFAGNIIPVSMFDPAALKIAQNYLPSTTDPCGKVLYGIPANNPDDQWIGRVDYIVSQKQSIYVRYYLYDYEAPTTFNGSNILTTTTAGNQDRSQTATVGDSYSFSPTMLNSFHATFDRRRDNRGAAPNLISPSTVGINTYQVLPNFIDFSVSNYNIGAGCGTCAPGHFDVNTYQLSDDISIIKGKHQFAFGVDARRLQLNIANNQQVNGISTFSGGITGDALADFLLGKMSQYVQGNANPDALRQAVFGAYAQDAFRLSPRITINYGVRWEPSLPAYDAFSRGNQFNLANFNAGIVSTEYPAAPAGLLFSKDAGNANGKKFADSHWLTTSPRVGIVWDPAGDGKQTIRAAGALMHDTTELFFPERWTTNPPYASSVTINNPVGPFSNPWAGYPGGDPFPGAAIFPIGGTYVSIPASMKPTYMIQWNLSYQRQLAKDWLLTMNYLGNTTNHIWGARDINPAVYIPGSTASTNNRRLLYLQNPASGKYYSSIVQADDGGKSSYNGLLASVQHRFANHFTLLVNYTWSHCVSTVDFLGELAGTLYQNPNNRDAEKGSCVYDHRQNLVASLVATSPAVGNAFLKKVTGNWQISPIFTALSGSPLTPTDGGTDISQTGQLQDRPNVVLPNNVYPSTQTLGQWFNPLAFAKQAAGTYGNAGRESIVGPGIWNIDMAVDRRFMLTEHMGVELRGDFFNIVNHGNWNNPTVAITSAQFGQITSFSSPRIIQMSAKFLF
jgi:hypothetical protein